MPDPGLTRHPQPPPPPAHLRHRSPILARLGATGPGRAALVAVHLVLALGLAGCFGDNRPRVVIEFGVDPDLLVGTPVEIDGLAVGKLEKVGEQTRRAFPVKKGEHKVRLLHARYACDPITVQATHAGQKIFLLAQFAETSTDGQPRLVLQP